MRTRYAVCYFLIVSGRTARGRLLRATDKSEYFVVLCSKCSIHGGIDDGVDGTSQKPQASSEDMDLKGEEKKNSFKL